MKLIQFSKEKDGSWDLSIGRLRFMWLPWYREFVFENNESDISIAWKGLHIDFYYGLEWWHRLRHPEWFKDTTE